jgi:hypothetical protein
MLLRNFPKGSKFSDAGIGENDIDSPLGRNDLVETVYPVGQIYGK